MHEVTAHPAAPGLVRLLPHLDAVYGPVLTPGTPPSSRQDRAEFDAAAKERGRTRCESPSTATAPRTTGC
jgi:hypothetical protein